MRPTQSVSSGATETEAKGRGIVAAVLAYVLWGIFPVYFKIAGDLPPLEVLAHRIVWAVPFGALILCFRRQWAEVFVALRSPAVLGRLSISAGLIAGNWLVFIWAVQHNNITQSSLGYYISPLISVLLGIVVFSEKLRRGQVVALLLAAVGVLVLAVHIGEPPWISLMLAATFATYGAIRKQVSIGAMPGLFVETLCLLPFAAGYMMWLSVQGASVFSQPSASSIGIALLAGPVTVLPLVCFAVAARRLSLATLGFLQYTAPTLQFLISMYYDEPLGPAHIVCFGLIWLAAVVFSVDAWHARSRFRTSQINPC
nr:protein RarD-like [Nerophis lumbriciformis]